MAFAFGLHVRASPSPSIARIWDEEILSAIRIDLPNRDGTLRPGMSATAWLPVGDAQSRLLSVPAAALQRVRDRWCVFVPRNGSTFEIRPVGRGRDLAGEVEILSGLKAGDTVVVDGAFLLKAESEKSAEEHEEH